MAVLKCKLCGGNVDAIEGQALGTCDSCGSTMTLPKVNDERILNLFERANQYRLQNEFDKAFAMYENILAEDNNNAEAHWGCILSKYGIEYVEDPKTHKRVPTCHRMQREAILSDVDYKAAVEFSDSLLVKEQYQKEAQEIAEIQKKLLSIASKEAPYDIFICYKESNNIGQRTIDSTIAQDVYYQLTKEGYRVFFARITLEDKLGVEYEPYIFAALNSAKIMLVIGTKQEYFNAVWVKNEWARFLDLARKDDSKLIIPCYRDMDAYELPDELAIFQSQDMNKIGFMQDLIRGIGKVLTKDSAAQGQTVIVQQQKDSDEDFVNKGYNLLMLENFEKAEEHFDKALELNPKNSKAHWGKLLSQLEVKDDDELVSKPVFLDAGAKNLSHKPNNIPYNDYVGTSLFEQTAANRNPTMGIFTGYENAIKFSEGDERKKYIDVNKQIIQKRDELIAKNKEREAVEQAEQAELEKLYTPDEKTKQWSKIVKWISIISLILYLIRIFIRFLF